MANPPEKPTLDTLKTSRFDRRMSIAKTSLNIGRRWAGNSVSGLFMNKEARDAKRQAFLEEQANYLVEELGKLKGSVVKIGQMLALYGEHMLPPEIAHALQSLNDDTATLAWHVIEDALTTELGDGIHALEIDHSPIGTASLAQVHRAVIKDTGQQVVLKVQYPGVADAIDSDLSLFKQLLKVTNAVPQTKALESWFEEIRDLLYNEVNYIAEAQTTKRFYERLAGDERFVVPEIIDEFTTARVICMSYEAGIPVTSPELKALPQSRRDGIGQAAIEIMIREIFEWGEMQTDPNFGNYLIRLKENTTNGKIDQLILLDFGAIRQFDEHLLSVARGLMKAGYHHDIAHMRAAMTGYDFFTDMSETVTQDMAQVFLLATEPFSLPATNPDIPYDCLDEAQHYIWAKSHLHARIMKMTSKSMQSREFTMPPKELMFISRKFIGAYTFLTVLDAHTDAKRLIPPFL